MIRKLRKKIARLIYNVNIDDADLNVLLDKKSELYSKEYETEEYDSQAVDILNKEIYSIENRRLIVELLKEMTDSIPVNDQLSMSAARGGIRALKMLEGRFTIRKKKMETRIESEGNFDRYAITE